MRFFMVFPLLSGGRDSQHSGSRHGLSSTRCGWAERYRLANMSSMNRRLKVGLVQQACSEDRDRNLATSMECVRAAQARGAQLVLLQELHTGVYFCQSEDTQRFDQAEPVPGPTTDTLGAPALGPGIVIGP